MQHATVFPVRPAVPKAELIALAARSDRKGLVQFGGHLALLAVTGSAVLWAEGSWGEDRKRVVQGKSVSVRVDLRGRRIINKKKKWNIHRHTLSPTVLFC